MSQEVDRQATLVIDDLEFHRVFSRAKTSAHRAAAAFVEAETGVKVPREAACVRFRAERGAGGGGEGTKTRLIRYKSANKQVSVALGERFELPMSPCYSCGYTPDWLFDSEAFERLDVVSECDPRYDKLPGYSCPEKQGFMPRELGKFEIVLTYVPPGRNRAAEAAQVWQVNVNVNQEGAKLQERKENDPVIQRGQVGFRVDRGMSRLKPPKEADKLTEFGFGFQGLVLGVEDQRCNGGVCIERGNLAGDLTVFMAVYFLGTLVSRVLELRDDDCQKGRKVLAAVSGHRDVGHQVIHLAGCGARGLALKGELEFQVQFEISLI